MKLVVGYDQALATQCYRRNLLELINPDTDTSGGISTAEVDYVAARLGETSVFSRVEKLGNPWTFDNEVVMARTPLREASRALLQKWEDVANNILLLEGVVGRAGAMKGVTYEVLKAKEKRLKVVSTLYAKTSRGQFRSEAEGIVLRRMSAHVVDWVKFLSQLPGNDAQDLLRSLPSYRIIMS
jgi:hypothetical protein